MKTLVIATILPLLHLQNIVCLENDAGYSKNTQYLNKCFDPSSLILQRCNNTPRRMWPFESSKTKACDYINNYLLCRCLNRFVPPVHDVMVEDTPPSGSLIYTALAEAEKNMKGAIRTILDDQPDKIRWQEFDKVKQASKKATEFGEAYRRTEAEKF